MGYMSLSQRQKGRDSFKIREILMQWAKFYYYPMELLYSLSNLNIQSYWAYNSVMDLWK